MYRQITHAPPSLRCPDVTATPPELKHAHCVSSDATVQASMTRLEKRGPRSLPRRRLGPKHCRAQSAIRTFLGPVVVGRRDLKLAELAVDQSPAAEDKRNPLPPAVTPSWTAAPTGTCTSATGFPVGQKAATPPGHALVAISIASNGLSAHRRPLGDTSYVVRATSRHDLVRGSAGSSSTSDIRPYGCPQRQAPGTQACPSSRAARAQCQQEGPLSSDAARSSIVENRAAICGYLPTQEATRLIT